MLSVNDIMVASCVCIFDFSRDGSVQNVGEVARLVHYSVTTATSEQRATFYTKIQLKVMSRERCEVRSQCYEQNAYFELSWKFSVTLMDASGNSDYNFSIQRRHAAFS
jgi:hypothetical protein